MKKNKYKFASSCASWFVAFGQQGIIFSILLGICMIIEKYTGFKMTDDYQAAQIILSCMVFAIIPINIISGFAQEKQTRKRNSKSEHP